MSTLAQEETQKEVFQLLLEQDDVSWKNILMDLVKNEQMDPWDVNITVLTQKYLQVVKEMQQHDLKVSGKILLAAALLLRMKSTHFIENDLAKFDQMLYAEEFSEEEGTFDGGSEASSRDRQKYKLIPRNPQPRSRKVSIHDLIDALQHAMETKKRILAQQRPVKFVMPKRKFDIMEVIYDLYHKMLYYDKKYADERLTFTRLLPPNAGKQEKAFTFIPLLHLENQHQVETEQAGHFDEIYIKLLEKKPPREE